MAMSSASVKTQKNSTKPESKRARVKKHVKAHYDARMPDKKHHRIIIWVVFLVAAATIAGQLLYPPDRALPLRRVAGKSVAWKSHDQLAEILDGYFRQTELKLTVADKSAEVPLASAGAELNTEPMIDGLVDYPFWQRLIPLTILLHMGDTNEADVYYTESVLKKLSEQQAKVLSFDAVNARLAIENGVLVATDERQGSEVTVAEIHTTISHATIRLGGTTMLAVPSKRIKPSETARSLEAVRSTAEAALARSVRIQASGQVFEPDRATVASWLQIVTDDAGKPSLGIVDDRLADYFTTIDAEVGIPAGQTNINLSNGREVSRTTGQTGKAIDRDQLKNQIGDWLLLGSGGGVYEAAFHDVLPSIMYDSKYTATEEGLRAYVADAAQRLNVHIVIQQLDGGKWSASARADESIPSASTYKLFVAKWLFDQMDKGLIHWDDPMLDTTVSVCFDRMTIASTNPCAEAWLAQAGRANFNQYIWGLGVSQGTNFNMPDATHTTANDLQKMMLGLNDGSLYSGANRDRLLHSLSVHPYRDGIPAGSGGQVWDKVGFLWNYVHDTAIVKHPKGTYVMTIMTGGGSYTAIANLTREIERIMYP
jgi:beta-lactamase class A